MPFIVALIIIGLIYVVVAVMVAFWAALICGMGLLIFLAIEEFQKKEMPHSVMYGLTGLCCILGAILTGSKEALSIWNFILYPLVWPLGALMVLMPNTDNDAARGGYYGGLLTGLLIWGAVFQLWKTRANR